MLESNVGCNRTVAECIASKLEAYALVCSSSLGASSFSFAMPFPQDKFFARMTRNKATLQTSSFGGGKAVYTRIQHLLSVAWSSVLFCYWSVDGVCPWLLP